LGTPGTAEQQKQQQEQQQTQSRNWFAATAQENNDWLTP
jgi:hypothetical protein